MAPVIGMRRCCVQVLIAAQILCISEVHALHKVRQQLLHRGWQRVFAQLINRNILGIQAQYFGQLWNGQVEGLAKTQ